MLGALVVIAVMLVSLALGVGSDHLAYWRSWCGQRPLISYSAVVAIATVVLGVGLYQATKKMSLPVHGEWERGLFVGLLAAGVTRVDFGNTDPAQAMQQAKNFTAFVMRKVSDRLDRKAGDAVHRWVFGLSTDDLLLHAYSVASPELFAASEPELDQAAADIETQQQAQAIKGRGYLIGYVTAAYVQRRISRVAP